MRLCPLTEESSDGGGNDPPHVAECHHGFGRGAFFFAVESIIQKHLRRRASRQSPSMLGTQEKKKGEHQKDNKSTVENQDEEGKEGEEDAEPPAMTFAEVLARSESICEAILGEPPRVSAARFGLRATQCYSGIYMSLFNLNGTAESLLRGNARYDFVREVQPYVT